MQSTWYYYFGNICTRYTSSCICWLNWLYLNHDSGYKINLRRSALYMFRMEKALFLPLPNQLKSRASWGEKTAIQNWIHYSRIHLRCSQKTWNSQKNLGGLTAPPEPPDRLGFAPCGRSPLRLPQLLTHLISMCPPLHRFMYTPLPPMLNIEQKVSVFHWTRRDNLTWAVYI